MNTNYLPIVRLNATAIDIFFLFPLAAVAGFVVVLPILLTGPVWKRRAD